MRSTEPWIDYWMGLAHKVATRSKDPSFAAGAVLVAADDKTQLSQAYNGPAPNVDDGSFNWDDRDLKRLLVSHAEDNSLWFAASAHGLAALKGSHLYVNGRPCSECMKMIGRAAVATVTYDDTNPQQPKMCDEAEWKRTQTVAQFHCVKLYPYSKLKGK